MAVGDGERTFVLPYINYLLLPEGMLCDRERHFFSLTSGAILGQKVKWQ